MSSIIVLDSSDEDESPPKKQSLKSTSDSNTSSVTNTTNSKNNNPKQRQIPSGITITPRLSPTSMSSAKSSNMQSLTPSALAASFQAFNSIINNERQTPTPPKGHMVGSINQRKRKTPTPPKTMPRLTGKPYGTMSNSSPAKAATTIAPLPPIMPMITGVHSMAAGTTPPLQLMATPPHGLGSLMGLNEQLMINPHLIPTSLPSSTTITPHPNPNQNNINNNFKIHLPFNKPTTTTPSPAASPASAPKTPSPQLTSSPQPSRADKNTKRIMPTTLLKSSDESWQRHKQITQNGKQSQRTPVSLNNDVVIEMLPPSTESPKSISASSSRHHTPMASPTTPKSQKSPDVIMVSSLSNHAPTVRKECETILDLTQSPDKVITSNVTEIVDLVDTPDKPSKNSKPDSKQVNAEKKPEKPPPKPPLEPEYEELIKECRKADPSKDMEKLIKSKLLKYYYEVHSDYVKSKSFRKNIRRVMESIKAKPDLVYYNLKTIVEELKVRRKARLVEEAAGANTNDAIATTPEVAAIDGVKSLTNETKSNESDVKNITATESSNTEIPTSSAEISATLPASTGNKKLDEQIKKLNKALYVLTKRIEVLEQAEVDWDDDDSSFLQVERYKKRACQIYEKICDLTGESKNAHRLVKKPIKFNETRIPQFNKTLQAFINRTKEFPDYYDVLRMLEHCNRTYSLGLVNFEIKNIAEDAFIKVGKLLQSRRKADLYETVTHFAGDGKDPAKTDPKLAAKLNENLKNHKKISDILEKFARKQDLPEEEEEKAEKMEVNEAAEDIVKKVTETATTSEIIYKDNQNGEVKSEFLTKTEESKNDILPAPLVKMDVDEVEEDEDDDDEDEDEEDEENLDDQVETLANGDISDNESDNEIILLKDNKNSSVNLSLLEPSGEGLNSCNAETKKSRVSPTNTKSVNELSTECIEIPEESGVADMETPAAKRNSENDCLIINNNNNFDISTNTTKTVKNPKSIEFSSPSSPPIPLATIIYTSNGKLKDTSSHQLLNNHDNPSKPTIINTATLATTTTADLKIVHVSSLEPDNNNPAKDGLTLNDMGRKISSTNKSLDEIVISDEES